MDRADWETFAEGFASTAYEYDHEVEVVAIGLEHVELKVQGEDDSGAYTVKIINAGKLRNGPRIFKVECEMEPIQHVSTPRAAFAVLYV
jgi:hypothetical protein